MNADPKRNQPDKNIDNTPYRGILRAGAASKLHLLETEPMITTVSIDLKPPQQRMNNLAVFIRRQITPAVQNAVLSFVKY